MRGRPPRKPDSQPPKTLAAGSEVFGRTMPSGVASALAALDQLQRDETAAVTFGAHSVSVEHRFGLVVLVFPDGTRATGTPEQAAELARLLTAAQPRR